MCVDRASSGEILDYGIKNGMKTLRLSGLEKVREGVTQPGRSSADHEGDGDLRDEFGVVTPSITVTECEIAKTRRSIATAERRKHEALGPDERLLQPSCLVSMPWHLSRSCLISNTSHEV